MNAPWNAPISDRFSSLCARVFSCRRHIGKREDPGDEVEGTIDQENLSFSVRSFESLDSYWCY